LQSLALYVLAAFRREQPLCAEAGLKYFSLGALSSGILLFGLSLIYGFAGSTDYTALLNSLNGAGAAPHGLLVGVGLTLAGLAFKLGAAPFHMWTPDVYEGVPTPVTAFFATAPKLAAFATVTRLLLGPLAAFQIQWQPIILFLAVSSMLVGAFGALTQKTLKRLLAYSSIGHSGFVLVALASGSQTAINALVIYFALYMLMTLGAFALLLLLRQKGKDTWLEDVANLAGLGKVAPAYAACFTIILFSMAGIPFLAGFFSKYWVLKTAIDAGFAWLALVGVLASVVSAGYYLRVIKTMYFDDAKIKTLHHADTFIYRAVLALSAFVMATFILWPTGLEYVASLARF
jgi:NADH-quinone oxidoreductase subunit N